METTISTLKRFLDLAETTLKTASDLIHLPNPHLCACPFDSRHRMPPESLFRHFLSCTSSPSVVDLALLDSLRYPNSLRAPTENRFVRSLLESDADLCLSLDEYGELGGSNFFYKDCPGVVSSSAEDSAKRTFNLPGVLSVECANFICGDRDGEIKNLSDGVLKLRILPTELWALRSEMEIWNDFPSCYSYNGLRVAACLFRLKESYVLKWVILNSPRYGIVIDAPVRDHIFVLLKLCLKAVWREALRSLELALSRGVGEGDGYLNLKSLSFQCLRLVEVLGWLASHLSVLYGNVSGKSIAIDMLKQCLLSAATGSLLFPLEEKRRGADALKEERAKLDVAVDSKGLGPVELTVGGGGAPAPKEIAEDKSLLHGDGSLFGGALSAKGEVFVSQVAAAIAALHERALLEERIKELRFGRPQSKFQRVNEHSSLSIKAIEERGKRPDYRPILEQDGLLWKRAYNPDSSKNKTREELLAEERDYKRRRMSYRGKKVKRSTTQVMRDIIEEHMEEIKQAGGIGCFVKGSTDMGLIQSGSISVGDMTTDIDQFRGRCSSSERSRNHSRAHEKQVHSDHKVTSTRLEDGNAKDQLEKGYGLTDSLYRPREEHHVFHDTYDDRKRSISKNNRDGDHKSRSPQGHKSHRRKDGEHQSRSSHEHRSHRRSHEQHRRHREQYDDETTRNKYDRFDSSSHRSRKRDDRHYSSPSDLVDDMTLSKYDRFYENNSRYGGRINGNLESGTLTQSMFDDRYDPSDYNRVQMRESILKN
eukprot:TRINITY_DN5079_c0_g1_i2.p1 TRINITY_DN5079_c0_g1~~TRINITY_DN5079_c0_g1_i2.p1  ORF type:complete len:867 (-),score=147.49 TRINITY_DN5079_c0_g1_i2:110-2398(-)